MKNHNSNSQRIAIFFASDTGVQRVMVNLAIGLTELGKQVDIIMPEIKGPYLSELPAKIRLFNLETRHPVKVICRLLDYLKKERPSVMIVADQQTNIAAVICRQIAGLPANLIITQHNPLSILKSDSRFIVKLLPFFAKIFFPWANKIVTVSQGIAEEITSFINSPINKIQVIYNPVITPRLFILAKEIPVHSWLNCLKNPIILGAGSLAKRKDFSTLISAFAQVRKKIDARLIIIGEGEEKSQLEKLVYQLELTEVVSFPGYVENPYSYMAKSSVFVLSSLWEGLPTVLIEAMALGIPIVSTNCPSGPSEILEGGKYGLLVPVGDIDALAMAILHTLKYPSDPDKLKAKAEEFTIQTVVRQYLMLIEN